MPGGLVLAGGEEFRPNCEVMDEFILEATGVKPAKVFILPTAAVTGPQKAASDGVRYFSSLGANASQIMVLDRKHADDEGMIQVLSGASIIYFTGGEPNYLLATLKGSRLFDVLRAELQKGAIIGGSSAGAMVMGSTMWARRSGSWGEGLGFAHGVAVLPHHEQGNPETISKWLNETNAPPGLKTLGIDARTCCFGFPGSWKVMGYGKVTTYHNGAWKTYSSGESLPEEF